MQKNNSFYAQLLFIFVMPILLRPCFKSLCRVETVIICDLYLSSGSNRLLMESPFRKNISISKNYTLIFQSNYIILAIAIYVTNATCCQIFLPWNEEKSQRTPLTIRGSAHDPSAQFGRLWVVLEILTIQIYRMFLTLIYKQNMQLQLQQSTLVEVESLIIFGLIMLFLWNWQKKKQFHKRISRSRSSSGSLTEDHKVIIAIEIKNLIVECTHEKKQGFLPLVISPHNETYLSKFLKVFGYGAYYRPMFGPQKIRDFLKRLERLPGVQLYLYTSLQKPFAQKLLEALKIEEYFPLEYRRYATESGLKLNEKKHPSWVDHNTRRVMIVTPNKEDFDDEYRKYFLLVHKLEREKLLKGSLTLIKKIVCGLTNSEDLHTEMDDYKAQIESDYEFDEDVTSQ